MLQFFILWIIIFQIMRKIFCTRTQLLALEATEREGELETEMEDLVLEEQTAIFAVSTDCRENRQQENQHFSEIN